jgi:allantoinase
VSVPFVIRSRRVLLGSEGEPAPAAVVIEGGKVARTLPYNDVPAGLPVVEGGGQVLMPGIVDTHAHINEPGRTDWEGFQTATRAAAAGGITTVIDMPLNSIPATTSLAALRLKAETAQGQCAIDYGFWGGVIPGNAGELEPMVRAGALGFKAFLIESGVDEFPMSREADLRQAMPILARLDVPLLVHAELDGGSAPELRSRSYQAYLESRPRSWESSAIRMMIRLARETGCAVHIVHLSAADALEDIRRARTEGVPITVETCPHYLHFEAERIPEGATQFKCAPPIREHENRERLWQGLFEGLIDLVVSDHSPCIPHLKTLETGDFGRAWGGIAGLQFSLPVVWTGMTRRGRGLRELATWMSARTARFAGLADRKGRIAAGFDADLVLWEPERSMRVERPMVLHKHDLTPYEGAELRGRVTHTWVGGTLVQENGKFGPGAPSGKQVRRSSS